VKVNENSKAIRHLFLKMHITRDKCAQKPEYQTLFVVGVPEFCDQVIIYLKFIYFYSMVKTFLSRISGCAVRTQPPPKWLPWC